VRSSSARDPRGRSTREPTAQNWRYAPKEHPGATTARRCAQLLPTLCTDARRVRENVNARPSARREQSPLIASLGKRGGIGRRSLRPREPAAPLSHERGYVRPDSAETIRGLANSLQQVSACSAPPTSMRGKRACAGRRASRLRASSRRPRASRGHQLGYSAGPFSTSRRTCAPSPLRPRAPRLPLQA